MNSASMTTSISLLEPGTIIAGRYQILRHIDGTGFGAVYEALDTTINLKVALKQTLSDDPDARAAFIRKAQQLGPLRHAALASVSNFFTEGENSFLVMDFVDGVTLAQL